MNQKRIRVLLAAALLGMLAIAGMTACDNPEKMKDVPQEALPKLEPNPLALVGKRVEGTVKGQFPPKYFNKKAKLVVTPVYTYPGGEIKGEQKIYQGEDVKENNTVVSYENGASYSIPLGFEFTDNQMREGSVELRIELMYKDKVVPFDAPIKVGIGTLSTQLLVEMDGTVAYAPHAYQRDRVERHTAEVLFPIQSSQLRKGELQREDVVALKEMVKNLSQDEKKALERMSIEGYASPDGPSELNQNLSKERGKAADQWAKSTLKEAKKAQKKGQKDANAQQEEPTVSVDREETDWEGMKAMVEKSEIQDKELILRVLSMYQDPETRNREMHQLGKVFQDVATEILPRLRRATMAAHIRVKGRTDEEIIELVNAGKIQDLLSEEAMMAATLPDLKDKKEDIYSNLTTREDMQGDPRPFNNLAATIIEKNGDIAKAEELLNKALEIDAENAYAKCNKAVLAMKKGDIDEAATLLDGADDAGTATKNNRGAIAIAQGKYSAAVEALRGQGSINEGLADLLAGQADAARGVLKSIDTPKAHYLLAVLAARAADESACAEQLKKAIEGDRQWADWAKNDVEFVKLRGSALLGSLLTK